MQKKRSRRYQRGSLSLSPDGTKRIGKWYYMPGKQTSAMLGLTSKLSEKQARILLDEKVRPMNLNPGLSRRYEAFKEFVECVFVPAKKEWGAWRVNTAKTNAWEIQRYILPSVGAITFEELEPSHLRDVMKSMVSTGAPQSHLGHVRGHLVEICRMAFAEGYLQTNIAEGLKVPKVKGGVAPDARPASVVSLADYAKAWLLLEERERLAFDLVLFAGLRESEVYGLQCGDVTENGINVQRSFHRGVYEDPKTVKSRREVGPPPALLERVRVWIAALAANGPECPVFPSLTLTTPLWAENVLRNYVRPRLEPAGLHINFAMLRRTHSTEHKRRNSDPKIIAAQQGHGIGTH